MHPLMKACRNTLFPLAFRQMEATGVWWLPWSSKPVTRRYRRVVGSIPIRLRQVTRTALA